MKSRLILTRAFETNNNKKALIKFDHSFVTTIFKNKMIFRVTLTVYKYLIRKKKLFLEIFQLNSHELK